ncbi:MAG TPA: hypothetical protein VFY91_05355 [Microbacterium sp.]|nr:hypothetical protein [Microbacterium sp.]
MSLSIDFDADRWLFVPNAFPWESFADDEQWADAVSRAFAEGPTPAPEALGSWLRAYLLGAARSNAAGAIRFAHLPTIDSPTAIVDIHDMVTDPGLSLADLTQQDAPRAVRPADVVPFASENLGDGVKATRYVANDREAVVRGTHWVWRTQGRDIVMLTGTADLAVAEALDPLLDELARAIRLAGDPG